MVIPSKETSKTTSFVKDYSGVSVPNLSHENKYFTLRKKVRVGNTHAQ